MKKQKFELTTALVNVEPDIALHTDKNNTKSEISHKPYVPTKEQINLKISSKIKKEFKIYCVKNMIKMNDALEIAISNFINNKQKL